MKILISAVGGSDPIKGEKDGPMLHCARVYQPDKIILFFTHKMYKYEMEDNRYTGALDLLGKKLNHLFDVECIKKEELVNPHLFDSFFSVFQGLFDKVFEENDDVELYINASSGTPAIKSALVITAAMYDRMIKVIQVSSGATGPIHNRDSDDDYDLLLQWECDTDNLDDFEDRTIVVKSDQFLSKVKKSQIVKFIKSYDYISACVIANEVRDYISDECFSLINAAMHRKQLEYVEMKKYMDNLSYTVVPVTEDKKRKTVEYMLWLDVLLKTKDYLSFIRGITPMAMEIMVAAIENKTPIHDIKEYCNSKERKGKIVYYLSPDLMQKDDIGLRMLATLNRVFRSGFSEKELSTAQLDPIITEFSDDKKLIGLVNEIRKVEEGIRNPAAHAITAVTSDYFKRNCGKTPEEFFDIMKKASEIVRIMQPEYWDSYDEMNDRIIALI